MANNNRPPSFPPYNQNNQIHPNYQPPPGYQLVPINQAQQAPPLQQPGRTTSQGYTTMTLRELLALQRASGVVLNNVRFAATQQPYQQLPAPQPVYGPPKSAHPPPQPAAGALPQVRHMTLPDGTQGYFVPMTPPNVQPATPARGRNVPAADSTPAEADNDNTGGTEHP